jgi:uncharacterized protein
MEVTVTRHHALIYDYVTENVLERRAPHREEHIGLVREALAEGRILMAGALGGDTPHGGLLVFAGAEPEEAERFARADPYVRSGLVTAWRVEPWDTVT